MIALEKFIKKNPELWKAIVKPIHITDELLKVLGLGDKNNHYFSNQTIGLLRKQLEGKDICVVGNSPILNNSGLGKEIDEHDAIFRCNLGILPQVCNTSDTGVKTTHYAMGNIPTIILNKNINKIINNTNITPLIFTNTDNIIKTKLAKLILPEHTEFIHNYNKIIEEKGLGIYPSTGTKLLCLLNNHNINFNHLSIYGFSFSSDNRISGISQTNHERQNEEHYILNLVNSKENIKLIK